jgi:very-short-patch-repair endonuclease
MVFLIIVVVAIFVIVGVIVVLAELFGVVNRDNFSPYQKKKYLFDTKSEFDLYKILLELYGDKYHIFPQINYSHLIEIKNMERRERHRHRSRIDRKSADFVVCDKERVVPQLVIELDGSVHDLPNKQRRDKFIDDIMKSIGLPILHLKTENLSKESIREEVDRILLPLYTALA